MSKRRKIRVNALISLGLWALTVAAIYTEDQQVMAEPSKITTFLLALACLQTIRTLCMWVNSYRYK